MRKIINFAGVSVLWVAALLSVLLGLSGCAEQASGDRVRAEKATSEYWKYCDLAKETVGSDRSLLFDLGECYEHGSAKLPQDREAAISYYEQGARWGNPQAIAALKRLGVAVPAADLLHEEHEHLDERRSDELRHAVLLTVLGTDKGLSRHPHYDPTSGALSDKPDTNIAGSPAFKRYLDGRARNGQRSACALVYVHGSKVEPRRECK